jgi:hypothetical protein
MKSRCQNRTRVDSVQGAYTRTSAVRVTSSLRFLTDSKTLSGFFGSYVSERPALMSFRFAIGRERAFTKAPANGMVFQPKAARRKL